MCQPEVGTWIVVTHKAGPMTAYVVAVTSEHVAVRYRGARKTVLVDRDRVILLPRQA